MNMAKYCKQQGMTKEQYKEYKSAVEVEASAKIRQGKKIHKHIGGMYYLTNELLELKSERDYFILNTMKGLGAEFINNNELYRIV